MRSLRTFVQPLFEHATDYLRCVVLSQIVGIVFKTVRSGVMFIKYNEFNVCLFFILRDEYDRVLMIVNREIFSFGGIGLGGNIGKHFFYLCLYTIYVDISYNNNSLQVWTIPLFIIIS